jgi:FkbM family methyltransferase
MRKSCAKFLKKSGCAMSDLIRKRVTSTVPSNQPSIVNDSSSDIPPLPEAWKLKTARTERLRFVTPFALLAVMLLLSYNTFSESMAEATNLSSTTSTTSPISTSKSKKDHQGLDEAAKVSSTSSPTTPPPVSITKNKRETITVTKQNEEYSFSIEVYRRNDIVSEVVRSPQSWDQDIANMNSYFKEYSSKHNIPLANLTFIDIGANIGWFSLNMAALGVQVIAFEPMQQNIDLFNQSLQKTDNIASGVSGRIKLYPHGLGTKDQMCIIYSHDINVGDGHVKCVENEENLKKPDDYSIRGRIPVHRLDDVLDVEGLNIVAIKMDTEGYECNVLEGGRKVILEGGAQAILTEFASEWMKEKGGDPLEFMRKLAAAGYRLKRSSPDVRKPLSNSQRDFMTSKEMVATAESGPLSKGVHDLTLLQKTYISEQYEKSIIGLFTLL